MQADFRITFTRTLQQNRRRFRNKKNNRTYFSPRKSRRTKSRGIKRIKRTLVRRPKRGQRKAQQYRTRTINLLVYDHSYINNINGDENNRSNVIT